MSSRSHRSPKERDARSRAVQLLADKPLLRGALVLQHRSCGKSYCRCQTGQKPPALHEAVRAAIEAGRQIDQGIDHVSDLNLQALLEQKQAILTRKGRPQSE